MIKAVFFDLDDTLYDYSLTSNYAIEKLHDSFKRKLKIPKKDFLKLYNQSKKEIRQELKHSPDSHDRMLYFQRACEKLGLKLGTILKLYDKYYSTFFKNLIPREGVKETFRELKKKGYTIIIVTNEVLDVQLRKVKKIGVLKYGDFFISSENVGVDKPAEDIFWYALKKINATPKEVIMVGNSEDDDIRGAKKIGIKSILFSKKKKIKSKADYVISEIKEVLKIVDVLNN